MPRVTSAGVTVKTWRQKAAATERPPPTAKSWNPITTLPSLGGQRRLNLKGASGERGVLPLPPSRTSAATGPGCPALACGGERRRRWATAGSASAVLEEGSRHIGAKGSVPCRRRVSGGSVAALALVWRSRLRRGPQGWGEEWAASRTSLLPPTPSTFRRFLWPGRGAESPAAAGCSSKAARGREESPPGRCRTPRRTRWPASSTPRIVIGKGRGVDGVWGPEVLGSLPGAPLGTLPPALARCASGGARHRLYRDAGRAAGLGEGTLGSWQKRQSHTQGYRFELIARTDLKTLTTQQLRLFLDSLETCCCR